PDNSYKVTVWDDNSCFDTLNVFIPQITCGPEITVTANPDTICLGDTTQLSATSIGGSPPYTYVWNNTASLTNPNDSITQAYPLSTTIYQVIVTDGNGDRDTTTAQIVVNQLPLANAGNDSAICINSTKQLLASGGLSYVWSPAANLNNPSI